jgi:hypothetical protein
MVPSKPSPTKRVAVLKTLGFIGFTALEVTVVYLLGISMLDAAIANNVSLETKFIPLDRTLTRVGENSVYKFSDQLIGFWSFSKLLENLLQGIWAI